MSDNDWHQDHARSFAVFLNGNALRDVDEHGNPIRDDSFLLLFNAHHEPVSFTAPGAIWRRVAFAARYVVRYRRGRGQSGGGSHLDLPGRTVVVTRKAVG